MEAQPVKPTPHLDALDRELDEWRQNLEIATSNLLALTELPIYLRLSKRDSLGNGETSATDDLVGDTRARVRPALDAVHELFEGFARLKNVIGRAEEARRALNWPWMFESKLEELDRLLHSESVELAAVETPLEQRGLLSRARARRQAKPKELLQAMTRIFENARDTLVSVGETWEQLPLRADDARREIDSLRVLPLVSADARELERLEARLGELLPMLPRDPLSAKDALDDEVWPRLRAFRERLAIRQRDEADARRELSEAEGQLSKLQAVTLQARESAEEVRRAIANVSARDAAPDSVMEDFASWLATLRDTARDGRASAARIGLQRWREAVGRATRDAEAARDFNRTPLEQLRELRGQLDALTAKMRALQARGVGIEATLPGVAREADELLSRRPVPLSLAQGRVSALEDGLKRV